MERYINNPFVPQTQSGPETDVTVTDGLYAEVYPSVSLSVNPIHPATPGGALSEFIIPLKSTLSSLLV